MKFSIIVPTYNREKYIAKCIDSVLNQTYNNFELIIVDDGSTDNTAKIVRSYKDPRIMYVKNQNHGISYSRNFGIDKASGEYIIFLDSDDYLHESAFDNILVDFNDSDILIFDYTEIFEKNNTKKENKFPSFKNYNLKEHPELINIINLGPCNKVYKRSLFKDESNRFPLGIKYEDFPLLIKLFKEAKNISSCGKQLTNVVVHEGSETLTVDEKVFDIFKGFDMVKETLNDDIYKEELSKLLVRKITTYTVSQRTQKDKKLINKFIDEAFKYLKEYVPDYKDNKYYEDRPFIKRTIEKNKTLTKLYCKLYRLFK